MSNFCYYGFDRTSGCRDIDCFKNSEKQWVLGGRLDFGGRGAHILWLFGMAGWYNQARTVRGVVHHISWLAGCSLHSASTRRGDNTFRRRIAARNREEPVPVDFCPGICYLGDKPHSPNLSDLAECVILCTFWLQSPGKVYCRAVNIWVTLVELRGPISNGNGSETKANESFDSGVFFDIEVKRTPSIVSKLFSKTKRTH